MFVQVIQGKVRSAQDFATASDNWRANVKPGAIGYLGSTSGVTSDGHAILLARFESAEAAAANSARPEQAAWWDANSGAFGGDVSFHDCAEVDTAFGGGSNDAGFVQVIQGKARDQERMRALATEMEAELRERRSDILGILVAWHGDGNFTQAVYFKSQEAAREAETATQNDDLADEFMSLFDGPPTFFDLADPDFD